MKSTQCWKDGEQRGKRKQSRGGREGAISSERAVKGERE
jgi:hypothetical protein